MKSASFFISIILIIACFANCNTSKKTLGKPVEAGSAQVKFDSEVQQLLISKCSPCHFSSPGDSKEGFNNYGVAKSHIDEILERVKLNKGEKGFMPMKSEKLSDSSIAILEKWKADGLTEK